MNGIAFFDFIGDDFIGDIGDSFSVAIWRKKTSCYEINS